MGCKEYKFALQIQNMDNITTLGELKEKSKIGKLVVLFYASWCPFCRAFLPIFESYEGKASVPLLKLQVDEDENPLWDEYKVEVIPTLLLFKDGKVVVRADAKPHVGLKEADLSAILKKV